MRSSLSIALLVATSACVVYEVDDAGTYSPPHGGSYEQPSYEGPSYEEPSYEEPVYEEPPPINWAPEVIGAEAGVYWDNYYADDIWYFEAEVDDFDGPYDVVEVWADVYDEWGGGVYLESFELFPTDDPWLWFSDWLGQSVWLDPFYAGYTVDFVAYDAYDAMSAVTVVPWTY